MLHCSDCAASRAPLRQCLVLTCNNYARPLQGASLTAFRRLLPPRYENGFNTPVGWDPSRLYNGLPKPSARHISNRLISTAKVCTG